MEEEKIKQAQERVRKAQLATTLLESPEGEFLLEYVNERVSTLVSSITGQTPVSDRDYLSAHGGIKELKSINIMLHSTAGQLIPAQEELHALTEDDK